MTACSTSSRMASPSLRDAFRIGEDTAADMLIAFEDNPERIRSEAAFVLLHEIWQWG